MPHSLVTNVATVDISDRQTLQVTENKAFSQYHRTVKKSVVAQSYVQAWVALCIVR